MLSNYLENKLKDKKISASELKTLKVIYIIYAVLIIYLSICAVAYGFGYLVAKLELFYNK